MKTLEEFIKEIRASEELQNALKEIKGTAALEEFLKKHGCQASPAEREAFVKTLGEGELADSAAAAAAGGVMSPERGKHKPQGVI